MIEIKDVNLILGKSHILQNINLTLEDGKTYGLVGNNGSGKTMLMRCICGFIKPTSGHVSVDGKIVGKDMDYLNTAGIILENPGFIGYYTGLKNLKFLAGLKGKIDEATIINAMERCGLDPKLKLPVRKYSLGMRQRLGIAQAIMEDPDILILDEPFNGLDKNMCKKVRELLAEEKKKGKTILLVSHNQHDIKELCDRTVEIDAGIISFIC